MIGRWDFMRGAAVALVAPGILAKALVAERVAVCDMAYSVITAGTEDVTIRYAALYSRPGLQGGSYEESVFTLEEPRDEDEPMVLVDWGRECTLQPGESLRVDWAAGTMTGLRAGEFCHHDPTTRQ